MFFHATVQKILKFPFAGVANYFIYQQYPKYILDQQCTPISYVQLKKFKISTQVINSSKLSHKMEASLQLWVQPTFLSGSRFNNRMPVRGPVFQEKLKNKLSPRLKYCDGVWTQVYVSSVPYVLSVHELNHWWWGYTSKI